MFHRFRGLGSPSEARSCGQWRRNVKGTHIAIGALTDGKPFLIGTRDERSVLDLDEGVDKSEPMDITPASSRRHLLAGVRRLEGTLVVVTGAGSRGEFDGARKVASGKNA